MKFENIFLALFLFSWLFSQENSILPGQKTAISSLATSAGFSTEDLNSYLFLNYGVGLTDLTRIQGAEIIRSFQAGNVSKPKTIQKETKKTSASFIEPGMNKQFHFRDGSVRDGEVTHVKEDIVTLKTSSGIFTIPKSEFLDETAEIKNKKGEMFSGVVLGETEEEFVLRTQYGDAVVQKRDISSMKRYYGGVLETQTENKKTVLSRTSPVNEYFFRPHSFSIIR